MYSWSKRIPRSYSGHFRNLHPPKKRRTVPRFAQAVGSTAQKADTGPKPCSPVVFMSRLPAMSGLGFKEITGANLRESDISICFPLLTEPLWVEGCLKPTLQPKVPKDVAALFEVARGCMIYGWFFYPLITLGTEQCHRVLETAAKVRCQQLGLQTTRQQKNRKRTATSFAENIEALVKQGAISPTDAPRWKSTRKLRNWASHPDFQTVLAPGMTLGRLQRSVDLLNSLFR